MRYCKIPRIKDWDNKGTIARSQETIIKHFGSWRRAKMMAGLEQLLEEMGRERLIPTSIPTAIVNSQL